MNNVLPLPVTTTVLALFVPSSVMTIESFLFGVGHSKCGCGRIKANSAWDVCDSSSDSKWGA